MKPHPEYVTQKHTVSPAGHTQVRVVDMNGNYVSLTVKRKAAINGAIPNVIARALAARPTQTRSYP